MAHETLDCRGLACPSPVLKTREMLEAGACEALTVLVDNQAARENVSRFLRRAGFSVREEERPDGAFAVTGERSGACEVFVEEPAPREARRTLVLLATDRMGTGDDELGRKLVLNFLGTLKEMCGELFRLVLVNAGVKLAIEGSAALPALAELEACGVRILVCGTCLTHFGLLDAKRVGETTNMLDIVTAMQLSEKVISFT